MYLLAHLHYILPPNLDIIIKPNFISYKMATRISDETLL